MVPVETGEGDAVGDALGTAEVVPVGVSISVAVGCDAAVSEGVADVVGAGEVEVAVGVAAFAASE